MVLKMETVTKDNLMVMVMETPIGKMEMELIMVIQIKETLMVMETVMPMMEITMV